MDAKGALTMALKQNCRKWITAQDGLDKLTLQDAPAPDPPGTDEVLVEIKAVSLNYRDTEGVIQPPFFPSSSAQGMSN